MREDKQDRRNVRARQLHIDMPDGAVWGVPVAIIAQSYAAYLGDENSKLLHSAALKMAFERFEDDEEVLDWAANNMDWSDVEDYAYVVTDAANDVDYDEGWTNGDKVIT